VSFDKGTLRHQQAASACGRQPNVLPQDSQTRVRSPLLVSMMRRFYHNSGQNGGSSIFEILALQRGRDLPVPGFLERSSFLQCCILEFLFKVRQLFKKMISGRFECRLS